MEAVDWERGGDEILEVLRSFILDIPLILAAIAANDNRLDLEDDETTAMESPNVRWSEGNVSGAVLEPVAVAQCRV